MIVREPQVCPCGVVFLARCDQMEQGRGLFCSRGCANRMRKQRHLRGVENHQFRADLPTDPVERARVIRRQDYLRHRDDRLARNRAYRQANPEKVAEVEAAYQQAHPEMQRAANRRFRERHPERAREQARRGSARYRQKPEAKARAARYQQLRRAGTVKAERWFLGVLLADPCAYCGAPTEHLDHVVPSIAGGANGWENLTGACGRCNGSKHHTPLLLWLAGR